MVDCKVQTRTSRACQNLEVRVEGWSLEYGCRFRFQKTTEVAAATADTVKHKWNDMRNSSLFKSFESKLGTAYSSVSETVIFTLLSWVAISFIELAALFHAAL